MPKTNPPPWHIKWKFGWEAQLFMRGNTANTAASITLLKITSFQALPLWPTSTGRKSPQPHPRQAHWECEAGHGSPHTPGHFQSPREQGPEEGTVCHQQLPMELGRHCCHLLCYLRWQGTSPEAGSDGERAEMCSSYTEQQLGKQ